MATDPEKSMRRVVEECTDCDICRHLMDTSCLMFPELYRLWDEAKETGAPISSDNLRRLADLCNFCALCPCPPVRAAILDAKSGYIARDGLAPRIRLIEDVALLGRICGTWPQLTNAILQSKGPGNLSKKALGIHSERQLPSFPRQTFLTWAKHRGLDHRPDSHGNPRVAYFAGCTANYLYPEVARAAVSLLQAAGADVWVPPQNCCGMPPLLEGDRRLALSLAEKNIQWLSAAVAEGFAIVCSCPTCGYVLKEVLREGAYYSDAYQRAVGATSEEMMIPVGNSGRRKLGHVSKSVYGGLLTDAGCFSGIDPNGRIAVAENTFDLGDFLLRRFETDPVDLPTAPFHRRMVYYPPCHLREQKIGTPYQRLLARIPGARLKVVDGDLYCCGMAGIMGFKKEFHRASINIGTPLMERIESMHPEILVTDCLSCRLQFNQLIDVPVMHPIEVLLQACGACQKNVPGRQG
jgi:glycerol-3-phosphate dehydrogenase subunit C